jgi:uncharacterized sulfatase
MEIMSRLPNLVLIMTDTQGSDCTGTFNPALGSRLQTAAIDRLAAEGVACERAYTTCPVCTPARSGLFTGIHAQRSGAWTNLLPLGQGMRHMGQWLRSLGYRTAYTGKWHLDGHDYFGTGKCPEGWEEPYWFDGRNYLDELTPAERRAWRDGHHPEHAVTAQDTWAWRCNRRAEAFLESCRKDERPFLLVVSYDEPHGPCMAPPEDLAAVAGVSLDVSASCDEDLSTKPTHYLRWRGQRSKPAARTWDRAPYFACNRFVDRMIGEVVAMSDAMAIGETCIAYTSDHGDMHGSHGGMFGKGPSAYDEIARIPLIFRGAGLPTGKRMRTPVSHADVLPTFLDLAGMPTPPPVLDGSSLLPLFHGDERADREVVVEFHRYEMAHDGYMDWSPMRALIGHDWKLTLHERHGDELYDQSRDPHEISNLIADPASASVRDAMHDRLLRWMDEHRDPFRGGSWRNRAWRSCGEVPPKSTTRPLPADGVRPVYLDYDTAAPTRGTHRENE